MAMSIRQPEPAVEKAYAAFAIAAGSILLAVLELSLTLYRNPVVSKLRLRHRRPPGRSRLSQYLGMGGRSAFSGGPAAWFDFGTYSDVVRHVIGHPDMPPVFFWSYPPHLLLFIWPFGLLAFLPAYVLWCVVGLALYVWAALAGGVSRRYPVSGGRTGRCRERVLWPKRISDGCAVNRRPCQPRPAADCCRHPVRHSDHQAAIRIAAACTLVMTSRWRVIAAAAATAAALVIVTAIWFGPHIWVEYLQKVVPQQRGLLISAGNYGWPIVSSVFVGARLIGLPDDWAWAAQALSSCCALGMVIWTFWRRRDPVLSLALFVTATFLFSPWMLSYDMVVFGWVGALCADERTTPTSIIASRWRSGRCRS